MKHAATRLSLRSGLYFRRPEPVMRTITLDALFTALLCALMALPVSAEAQDSFRVMPAGSILRDVCIDAQTATLYFAAYEREEVWKVNGGTGEAVSKVASGRGTAHVALSPNGRLLASVNTLSADAVVFDAGTLVAVGTFPCGEGASNVAAVGNTGFAVVNRFANSMTIIDAADGSTMVIEDVGQVPNGVAFSEGLLGVTTRLPASILLLDASNGFSSASRKRVELPATPVAVAAQSDGRFLVATEDGLVRVDGKSGQASALKPVKAQELAVCGERVLALSGNTLVELDSGLVETARTVLPVEATQVACSGGLVVLVAPAEEAWLLGGAAGSAGGGAGVQEQAPIEPVEPAPAPAVQAPEPAPALETKRGEQKSETSSPVPVRPEGDPSAKPDSSSPVVVEAEPVKESKAQELEPFPALPKPHMTEEPPSEAQPEPETAAAEEKAPDVAGEKEDAPVSPEPEPQQAPPAAPEPDAARPEESPYAGRPRTLTTFGTGAPQFTREAPEAAPISGVWRGSLSEAFARGWDFANLEGAFEQQDWNQPLEFRGVKADRFRGTPGEDGQPQRLVFQGDVSWDWAESTFHASTLDANLETREITIEEGHLERELSSLDADRLYYRYPSEFDEDVMPLIEAQALTDQERARRLYTMGYGEADNIELIEPFRELRARHVEYDFAQRTGQATDVRGRLDVLYFGVDELEMAGPEKAYARDAWVTTCPGDPPIFRLRLKEMEILENDVVVGRKGRLQIGKVMTPVYLPKWTFRPGMDQLIDLDFDSGRAAELGYYMSYGQRFAVSEDADAGFRFFPTEKEGVGFGIEGNYDYMTTPKSPLFRSEGDFRSLVTTKERGYFEAYHRHELTEDAVMLLQMEYWDDEDIIKDFYYNEYRNRTEPRSFANVTYTQPTYIATGTFRYNVSDFVVETERMPEVSYHLLERRIAERFYVSFDTVDGLNEREPSNTSSWRLANVARASMDLDIADTLTVVPFYEADLSWYSRTVDDSDSDARFSNTVGVTAQSRFHRAYPGALGFSGFKHVVVPSLTYSYRPEPTMDVDETPRFDAYDNVYGRSRIEGKIGNILFARDALTGEVWQAARLTLYHGNDFWNEIRSSEDYEVELDLRPRPWWGVLMAGEHHSIDNEIDLDEPYLFQRLALQFWEDMIGEPFDPELAFQYNAAYGDYDRILSYLYYDDLAQGGRFGARLGFAYTETQDKVFNREILYGARYKLSEKWAFAFEHRYDLERNSLYQQEYEIRKRFKCFDWSVAVRDRAQGWDFNVAISLSAFPGAKVKF